MVVSETLTRDSDGKLSSFIWPGGYALLYLFADGEVCCAACANGENGSRATTDASASEQWRIVESLVYWEGPPETCAHCGKDLPSEYGGDL